MDAEIAKALYLGIVHDTGVFQYSNTTPNTCVSLQSCWHTDSIFQS